MFDVLVSVGKVISFRHSRQKPSQLRGCTILQLHGSHIIRLPSLPIVNRTLNLESNSHELNPVSASSLLLKLPVTAVYPRCRRGSAHRAPPVPWPCSPRTWPRPSRCVFGEVHPQSHPVHAPQLNYRLNFLFSLIHKSICVHTYLIGGCFIRVGINFTSFSPLLRRHPPLTRRTSRSWAWYPSQVRETESSTAPGPLLLPGAGVLLLPTCLSPGHLHLTTSNSPWSPSPRKLPGVLPDLLSTFPQLRSQENKGQLPVQGQRVEVTLLAFQK